MDYYRDILSRLIDIYERRKIFAKDTSKVRAISLDIKKVYPEYVNRYNHKVYKDINVAIDSLVADGYVTSDKDSSGVYSRVKLQLDCAPQCYKKLRRNSVPEKCENIRKVLSNYKKCEEPVLKTIIDNWFEDIKEYKKIAYDLKYDDERIEEILNVLQAILKLDKETYIRNFSTALFKDSKKFQKEYRHVVESILYDYTEEIVKKEGILEYYNLYENPTYVLIKGDAVIKYESSLIEVAEMTDGIALSNASLDGINEIAVRAGRVITVENLTTYYDSDEDDAVHIYLGGYHNYSKQKLLEKTYNDNKDVGYYHKGDIDVYGFLILESLREKTKIPFEPLMMDVSTLEKIYKAGLYKELTATDVKVIKNQINEKLIEYKDVLQYMLDNNCKVEQESLKALEIMGEN